MRDDGTTLSDDIHELYVYKVWGQLSLPSLTRGGCALDRLEDPG